MTVGLGSKLRVYDYTLTFSSEVEFVWKRPFTPVTLLFAITRYLPFIDNTFGLLYDFAPVSVCVLSFRFSFVSSAIGICIAEIVLILRTMAIWHGDKRIGIFLVMLLTSFVVPTLFYAARDMRNFAVTHPAYKLSNPAPAEYTSKLPACDSTTYKDHLTTYYVLFMVFESVILLLTLLKAKDYRVESSSKLSRTIFYDSIAFYVLILIISTINVTIAPAGITNVFNFLHRNLHSIVIGRIILDIRKAVYEPNNSGTLPASSLIFGDNVTASNLNQSQD